MRLLLIIMLLTVAYAQAATETWGLAPDTDHRGVQDTYLSRNNENYYREDELKVQTFPADTPASTVLMQWDISQIPAGSEIVSAKLQLYNLGGGVDDFYEIGVHQVVDSKPKIPQVTGMLFDGIESWSGSGYSLGTNNMLPAEGIIEVDKYPGYKEWTVTDMVQSWVDNPKSNQGLLLSADSASVGAYRSFASSEHSSANWRPRLVVSYRPKESMTLAELFTVVASWQNGDATFPEVMKAFFYWKG